MDWFEQITGFREDGLEATRARLAVEGEELVSRVNGLRHGFGRFETPTLSALRQRVQPALAAGRRTRVGSLLGDVRALHREPALAGALFQVASQFNALEMVSPEVTPEHGVTRYQHDPTQGTACAIAAGAATIWRNYFLPLGDGEGQSAGRQLDLLDGVGQALSHALGRPVASLWTMRNGYALASADGLAAIGRWLAGAAPAQCDALRDELAVAWHQDAEVTDAPNGARPRVSQIFCSALPVAYTRIPPQQWEPFARLVLEAAYEATLLAAAERRAGGGSPVVLLTRLGGGAFGNEDRWIDDAIERALAIVEHAGLDVQLVGRGSEHPSTVAILRRWARGAEASATGG
jgi:hypothetical protein